MTLSPEDRKRLREEEIYLEEVRRDLQDARQKGKSRWRRSREWVWTRLNSQVGGWFLSVVFVGFVGFGYTEYVKPRLEDNAKRHKLLVEIDFRVAGAMERVEAGDNRNALRRLNQEALYPDLGERNMVSLLWELRSLYGGQSIREELTAHVAKLAKYGTRAEDGFDAEVRTLRGTVGKLSTQRYFGQKSTQPK